MQHSSHSLDCGQLLMTTRESLRTLTCEALRLHLTQKHLSLVRKKDMLVEHLFQHLQESEQVGEDVSRMMRMGQCVLAYYATSTMSKQIA